MMGNYNFRKDSEDERKVKSYLEKNGLDVKLLSAAAGQDIISSVWKEGNHKEYDQELELLDNIIKTAEWKMDLKCISTGNCFVEYWCRGKDSGIAVTTSDYWVQIVLSNQYKGKARFGVWNTYDFKKIVEAKQFRDGVPGGDKWQGGRAAVGYLIKEKDLFNPKFLLTEKRMDSKEFLKRAGIELKW